MLTHVKFKFACVAAWGHVENVVFLFFGGFFGGFKSLNLHSSHWMGWSAIEPKAL